MVVCKFFLSGNCRYGANCRFEHPQNTGGQNQNQNRFAPLSGQNNGRKEQPWAINVTDVKNDMILGQGRPQWILSTYGPGRSAPASLLEDNEYSFEELRLRYYELASAGNEAQANQEAGALWSKAEDGMRAIAQNADDVIKFMEDAEKKHPNRYDFCATDGSKTREELAKVAEASHSSSGGGFGQAAPATGFGKPTFGHPAASSGFGQAGFGQPSQPAQSANPFAQLSAATGFGKPAFGQPAAGAAFGQTGFGQPSQPATGGFGQPSQPSGLGAPAFGQPSQPTSGFGQPSQPAPTFGQPAHSANPFAKPAAGFGQPSQPVTSFGQPSQPVSSFGQPSQPVSAFGQPTQPAASVFGKSAAPGGFGQGGFGQPSQPATSGFGQPSLSAAPSFGQLSQPTFGGFGQPSQPTTSGFGQPPPPATSGFGQPSQPATSGFGRPSQPVTSGSGQPSQPAVLDFGAGAGFTSKSSSASPFGQPPAATGGFGQSSNSKASAGLNSAAAASTSFANTPNAQSGPNPLTGQPPTALHYTETLPKRATNFRSGTKDVSSYAGRRVEYVNDAPCYERPDRRGLERIWFSEFGNGADVLALNAPGKRDDLEGRVEDYTDDVKQSYAQLFTKGGFGDAGMPMVPPMREWCAFDF